MPKSRLVKINDYALLEITYEHTTINTSSSGFTIIDNTIQGYTQVLNDNNSELSTGNVLDRSSVQLGANQWVRTEQDVPIPYLSTDQRFEVSSLSEDAPTQQWNVTYDRVRVHILSGYTFTSSSGFVLDVSYPETNRIKNTRVALQTYVNGDDYIVFNTRPMVINGANYDKYVEFLIPSLSDMITEYNAATDKQDAIAYYFTSDNDGFLTEGLIKFDFYEIEQVNSLNGYDYLTTGVPSYVSIEPQDQFSNLAAVIKQNGDYFEYYPTWDENFISDYIAILNETRGKYVVIHELTVSEQVGFSQLYSSSNVILQTDDFDQPSLFKPILKNSDTAFSFSIDYTMRLTNETDGSQIIRTASVTSFEPKKFGRNGLKLNVREDVIPFRVYNKISEGPVFNLPVPKQDIRVQRIVSPSFYENNNVSVSTGKLFIDKSGQFIPEDLFEWDIVFGQTEAVVLVSPFDNYFKFNVFRVTPDSIESLDLSSAQEINIIFETGSGNKYRYSLYQPFPNNETAITNQINDTKSGKLIFRVPANDATRMISDLPGKFYITVRNKNIVRARVSLEIASDLRGKEVTIPFSDWAQKSKDDLITVYNNLKPYTLEKKYLEIIEVIPDGLTGEETVVYKGNVEAIENYQVVLDKIEELRNNSFIARLNAVKDRESALDARSNSLNVFEAQLNSKESTLKALETALLGQQQTLEDQVESLEDQKTELDRRNALLKQREEELKRLAEEAKNNQSSSVKELSDIIKSLREEIERLSRLNQGTGNQGTGNQGTGNQGTGNQGTGNQGPQGGGKNNNFNVDSIIDGGTMWQDQFGPGGSGNLGTGTNTNTNTQTTTTVNYNVYYINTDTFVGRYEIRSFSYAGLTTEQKNALFNKEFVNDPRTNGGKYTELKKIQPRTFQAGQKAYDSKWFVEKENTKGGNNNNNGSSTGATTKIKFAVIEFGNEGFAKLAKRSGPEANIQATYEGEQKLSPITTKYTRTIDGLSAFKAEIALDEFYERGKTDLSQNKNTFLAGYSKYIDKLTKSVIEKEVSTVTNKTNSEGNTRTYIYSIKGTKYVNTLLSPLQDINSEIGFKLHDFVNSTISSINFGAGANDTFTGWNAVFEILSRNQGVGSFNFTTNPPVQINDWKIALAKFYDDLLLSLFGTIVDTDSIQDVAVIKNLVLLEGAKPTGTTTSTQYVRVVRTDRSGTSISYMTKTDSADFIGMAQNIIVYLNEVYTKDIPVVLEKTISGINYTYDKKLPYQVSDWLSGFPPGTIENSWVV